VVKVQYRDAGNAAPHLKFIFQSSGRSLPQIFQRRRETVRVTRATAYTSEIDTHLISRFVHFILQQMVILQCWVHSHRRRSTFECIVPPSLTFHSYYWPHCPQNLPVFALLLRSVLFVLLRFTQMRLRFVICNSPILLTEDVIVNYIVYISCNNK